MLALRAVSGPLYVAQFVQVIEIVEIIKIVRKRSNRYIFQLRRTPQSGRREATVRNPEKGGYWIPDLDFVSSGMTLGLFPGFLSCQLSAAPCLLNPHALKAIFFRATDN